MGDILFLSETRFEVIKIRIDMQSGLTLPEITNIRFNNEPFL